MKANSLKLHPLFAALISGGMLMAAQHASAATTITIGTVNNGDMVRMQGLSKEFETAHPDIKLDWVVLEENVLRQRLTTDIATKGGQFDVVTIGMYETGLWGKKGWLTPITDLPKDYDVDDIFPSVRDGLSVDNNLYALPFYAESSMTYYRADLFKEAGLSMPEQPTWDQIKGFAEKLSHPDKEQYGICLRGKAGWGENMALFTTMVNSFGGRWFDEQWKPEFTTAPEWKEALSFYVDLLGKYGPPGASTNGFNENLALFNSGKCAMWVDATVAGSFVTDKSQSKVSDNVGFAFAPHQTTDKGSHWLWAWALGIPASSTKVDAAKTFIEWATSKGYTDLVAKKEGIANIPPGTRFSTYSAEYKAAAPFAQLTLDSMQSADPMDSSAKPIPYVGVQYVTIPEFQAIGTQVGKLVSGALAGQMSIDKVLEDAQASVSRDMKRAGYIKD